MPSYEVLPEDTDAESLAGVPTWEAIMTLPVENILHAEYVYLPGERCLYIKTNEAVYNGEYTLSLETGVLVSAIFYEADGTLAYRYTFDKPVLGDPGDSFFILPDGTRIKEGEEAEN